jgi:hypothetical protein
MAKAISLSDVYDKNLNFLIGSGASVGLFPTLALKIRSADGTPQTIESIATHFEKTGNHKEVALVFMHYFAECIKPVIDFSLEKMEIEANEVKDQVVENYEQFIATILQILRHRKPMDKRCNIFTTNYDGCFAHVTDKVLQKGSDDFVLNDGTRGFKRKYLEVRNFNTFLCQSGVFERSHHGIPQINLVHLHGSVYWEKADTRILVDYSKSAIDILTKDVLEKLKPFSEHLLDDSKKIEDLPEVNLSDEEIKAFWTEYRKLPIVNPTKWKFHETVFDEHYYQMLRLLSYELEKPTPVLITFGFSFADEHILNLVKRSLSNRELKVFVCCFNAEERELMNQLFKSDNNVECICMDEVQLDFSNFNKSIFANESSIAEHSVAAKVVQAEA